MNIIWVATDGDDGTGTGSKDSPYLTIGKAWTEFADGDQIRLKDGAYVPPDALVFDASVSGFTMGSFVADNPGQVTITPVQTTTSPAVLEVKNFTRFEIKGLILNQATTTPDDNLIGIYAIDNTTLLCYRCTISDFVCPDICAGIYAAGCGGRIDRCTVQNFEVTGDSFTGVYVEGMDIINCNVLYIAGEDHTDVVGINNLAL